MVGIPPITTLVVPGGANEVEAFIVGQLRELRADEDNDSLRLHDGVKEGGYEFLNRDQSDARYQPFSAELLGFSFGAQEKGFLVRVGPAQYKVRKVQSTDNDIVVTNPRGTAGDMDLNLADTIGTAHTWSAVQTFVERIVAEDGLTGDTFGTHHGDVIGGNFTGDFTGTGHGDFDGTFVGDVDVRGHNFLTDDGQITENQIDPEAWIRRGVPLGAIIMWAGTAETIPESWALCDGTNGTPDLRSRFVIGAGVGVTYIPPGTVAGSDHSSVSGTIAASGTHTHPLVIDEHALTVNEIPAHHHINGITDDHERLFPRGTAPASGGERSIVDDTNTPAFEGLTSDTGNGDPHTHTGVTTDSGAHTHDITLDDISLLPPYYALCFIMKIV